jgi:uncharacterized cupin superfamily protein
MTDAPSSRRHANVVHRDEIEPYEMHRGKHHHRGRQLGGPAGSRQLGGTLIELPPGAISFPFHYHCANEEAVYVISGRGTVRLGEARVAVRAGDWIAHPTGAAHAHQMINDSDEPLVYLCISTKHTCEVAGYPDSGKLAMLVREPGKDAPVLRRLIRDESLDYWDGEPDAK